GKCLDPSNTSAVWKRDCARKIVDQLVDAICSNNDLGSCCGDISRLDSISICLRHCDESSDHNWNKCNWIVAWDARGEISSDKSPSSLEIRNIIFTFTCILCLFAARVYSLYIIKHPGRSGGFRFRGKQ